MSDATLPRRPWWRPTRGRFLLLLGACSLSLVVGEIGLRLALRSTVQQMLESRHGVDLDAERCMLCIGDSYTFGLYYRNEESFPGRLEELLNAGVARGQRRAWAVVNAGIPAQNTAQVTAALVDQLDRYRPDVVVVLAGHNNRWNLADPERQGALARWWNRLVLVKLARLAITPAVEPADPADRITAWSEDEVGVTIAGQEQRVDIEKSDDRRSDQATEMSCAEDFRRIVERCHEAGAEVVFTCYPSPEPSYAAPQAAARAVAEETGSLFVDVRETFGRLLQEREYHELLIPGDRHPTDRGYYRMAVQLAEEMAERGLVDWDGEGRRGEERRYPTRLRWEDGALLLEGLPQGEFQVVLARSSDPAQRFGSKTVPVAADELFARSREEAALKGELDEDGLARIEVPVAWRSEPAVAAAVIFYDFRLEKYDDLLVRDISAAVSVPAN